MSIRTSRTETLVRDLCNLVGEDGVVTDADQLEPYSADTYWKALAARAGGTPLGLPDVAVLPSDEVGVAAVLRYANERSLPVVPRGGGSGSQGGAVATRGGILLDLTRLDRIVDVDERSLTVTAEAGVNGESARAGPERARPHASALPGLGRRGDCRRLRRCPRVGGPLDAVRQDRRPRPLAPRRPRRRRGDRDRRCAQACRGTGADAAVRRLRGHARRRSPASRSSSPLCRPRAASRRSRSRRFRTGSPP